MHPSCSVGASAAIRRYFSMAFLGVLLVSSGCAAKRPTEFVQGAGQNLTVPDEINGREYSLKTGEILGNPTSSVAEEGVKVGESVEAMNYFQLVQISTDEPQQLLGKIPFRGRPNTQDVYKIRYELTDKYLKIYKVAQKRDLPFQEHFFIEKSLEDGRVMIPVAGYRIEGFIRVEHQKTSSDEESHHLVEVPVHSLKEATHVKIDWNSREIFQAVDQVDLFPSRFFDGEWYFAETVVEVSRSSDDIVGSTINRSGDGELELASRIRMVPRERELRVVSVSQDERLLGRKRKMDGTSEVRSKSEVDNSFTDVASADLKLAPVLKMPMEWKDYRVKSAGSDNSLSAEENRDRFWKERDFVSLKLRELESMANPTDSAKNRILDIEIDTNYFGFTVLQLTDGKSDGKSEGRKIKYSFLRADRGRVPYEPVRAFKSDLKRFGFFNTTKPFLADWEYYSQEDFEKRVMVSRFNPDAGKIVFHFSANSPQWLREVGRDAVLAWDDAFQKAYEGTGKSVRVELGSHDVQLGDIRYSSMNLIEEIGGGGLLGFGPSVTDPRSGEIISATSNIYVEPIRGAVVDTIRAYLTHKREGRLQVTVSSGSTNLSEGNSPEGQAVMALAQNSPEKLADVSLLKGNNERILAERLSKALQGATRCSAEAQVSMGHLYQEIESKCPEVLSLLQSSDQEAILMEKPALEACSARLMKQKVLSTLIHEMGHNLGLRHNFKGSVDAVNFPKTIENGVEKVVRSSSIMEYTAFDEDRLKIAGPYDVAAIQFGYAGRVELKDGNIFSLDRSMSIDEQLHKKGLNSSALKPYLFCTDEDTVFGDALCQRHDAGTTPLEAVEWHIRQFEADYPLLHRTRNRERSVDAERVGTRNLVVHFIPMRQIYDEWRLKLAEFVGKHSRYLEGMSVSQYQQVLTAMSKDAKYGPILEQYFPAAERVYQFLRDTAFEPTYSCVVTRGEGKNARNVLVEFEVLRQKALDLSAGQVQLQSCSDERVESVLAVTLDSVLGKGKVTGEMGRTLKSFRFSEAQSLQDEFRMDVVGNEFNRQAAFLALTARLSSPSLGGGRNLLKEFVPNLLDEPHHRADLMNTVFARILDGVQLCEGEDASKKCVSDIQQPQAQFASERELLTRFASMFRSGLVVPGQTLGSINRSATMRNMMPIALVRPSREDIDDSTPAYLVMGGQVVYAALDPNAKVAAALIDTYKSVASLAQTVAPSKAGMEALKKYVASLPKAGVEIKVQDALNAIFGFQNITQKASTEARCLMTSYKAAMSGIAAVQQAISALKEKVTSQEDLNLIMATPYSEWAKGLKLPAEFPFTQEVFSDLEKNAGMNQCMVQKLVQFKVFQENKNDYQEQMNLLLGVMSKLAD